MTGVRIRPGLDPSTLNDENAARLEAWYHSILNDEVEQKRKAAIRAQAAEQASERAAAMAEAEKQGEKFVEHLAKLMALRNDMVNSRATEMVE